MIDANKVITALECCLSYQKCLDGVCPYWGKCDRFYPPDDLLADAFYCLKDGQHVGEELYYINMFLGWLTELTINTDDKKIKPSEIIRRIEEGGLLRFIHDARNCETNEKE